MSEGRIPLNTTAERAALSLLHHSPNLVQTLPWRDEMFFHPANKIIFLAIESAVSENAGVDLIAITSRLEAAGTLEDVGGAGELTTLLFTYGGPNPQLIGEYFDKLSDAAVARNTVMAAKEHLADLSSCFITPADYSERVAVAATGPEVAKKETLRDQIVELYTDMERREAPEAFRTGILGVDTRLGGGVQRGELAVVAAETSRGKSVVLGMAAKEAAEDGKAVAIFSLEMKAKDYLKRIAANVAGCPIKGILERPSQPEINRASNAITAVSRMNLTVVDNLSEMGAILAEARRLARLGKADLVVIDYVQLVENSTADSREQAISEIVRKLKNLALGSNIAVFTASQLNDDGKLRESRAIGHHADQVLSISDAGITISKNRRGPRDVTVPVTLRGEISRFEEVTK